MTDDTQTQDWFSDDVATFGDRLAGARELAGLTPTSLAAGIGVSIDAIEAWESDLREPRANRLQMLAGILGVSLSWLITGIGDGPDTPADTAPINPAVNALLAEMRALRGTLTQAGNRLAVLEKQLRKQLSTV